MLNKVKIKLCKTKTPIQLTNKLLAVLYNKLLNVVTYQKALYQVNLNLGSNHEPHDYVQETLITLIEKYNKGIAVFYSEAQLWSFCLGILEMRLMRQHRDYTIVKSRSCQMVNLEGETISGAKVEDIASYLNIDTLKEVDNLAFIESLKDYVLGFTGSNASIVPISKLFTLDASNKVISVYTLVATIDNLGISKALTTLNIPKWEHSAVIETLADFLNLKDPTIGYRGSKPSKHVLSTREKFQIKHLMQLTVDRQMITLNELENALNV